MAMAMAAKWLNSVFFFLMIISLFFLIHFLSPAQAASKLVEGVCHETNNYSFCIQALESDPKTRAAKNYMDLAVIALNLGISNSTATRSYIARLYKNPKKKRDHRKKSALKSCLWGYDGTVLSFRSALMELKEDPLTANYNAKVAGDGAVYCSSFMASARIKDSSISDGNRFASSLSFIAFLITNHLE